MVEKYLNTKICYADPDDFDATEARSYYSIDKTNQYLSCHHHKIKGKPNPAVSYTGKGYEF